MKISIKTIPSYNIVPVGVFFGNWPLKDETYQEQVGRRMRYDLKKAQGYIKAPSFQHSRIIMDRLLEAAK